MFSLLNENIIIRKECNINIRHKLNEEYMVFRNLKTNLSKILKILMIKVGRNILLNIFIVIYFINQLINGMNCFQQPILY